MAERIISIDITHLVTSALAEERPEEQSDENGDSTL